MNIIEQKCEILKQTPQVRWFDLRLKAILMLFEEMGMTELNIATIFPMAERFNIEGCFFYYDNEFYFLLAEKIGNTVECFHLERTNSSYGYMLSSHIVLSSDDDPRQETFLPSLCLISKIGSTKELMQKCRSIIDLYNKGELY